MASTYPLEIVQAARFVKDNPKLQGDQLNEALKQHTWDDSVKSMVFFPQVLTMMNDKLDWLQKLGDAFLAQKQDLMAAVQRLRARAEAAGQLKSNGNTTVLQIGNDDWPFPIPLVKDGERWRFDARKGRQEIIARRIGRNELYTIQTCLAYVDAQREYYAEDRNGDGILEYARQFGSTPGKRDGLYWPTKPGEPPSPLGDLIVRARAEGYRRAEGGGPTPFHGYLYRILTAQGPDAPDGMYDYITRGHMIAGFALVAFPAQYDVSGVMTFIVNHDGVVYQKDLGPNTRATAIAMRTFNPDATWTKAEVPEVVGASN